METKTDRRIEKTRKLIIESFLALLAKKDISKITVAEISRMANISRGTFYLHYKDTNDIYEQLEDEFCKQLVTIYEDAYPTMDATNQEKLLQNLFLFLENNMDIISAFCRNDKGNIFFKKVESIFNEKVLWEVPELYTSGYDVIESSFVVNGILSVIRNWIVGKTDLSKDELVQHLFTVLRKLA